MPFDLSSSPPTRTEVRWATLRELRRAGVEAHGNAHWRESGIDQADIPLAPDWRAYAQMEKSGMWRCVAAWRGSEVVGYAGFVVSRHLQFAVLHALNISIYVMPGLRGIAPSMIREAAAGFARIAKPNPVRIIYEAPKDSQFAKVLERMGYRQTGTVHAKMVRA